MAKGMKYGSKEDNKKKKPKKKKPKKPKKMYGY